MTSLMVELQDDVTQALRESAEARRLPLEQVASEVIERFVRGEERPLDHAPWTAEDLAAIQEGMEQAERGETIPHEEVMASIRSRLGI